MVTESKGTGGKWHPGISQGGGTGKEIGRGGFFSVGGGWGEMDRFTVM